MQILVPRIDWVTFTTWDVAVHNRWRDWLQSLPGERRYGQVHVYSGVWVGSAFVGMGEQSGGKKHFMARVSGDIAHDAFYHLTDPAAKCTRLDVQVTIPLPVGYSARGLVDDLRVASWGTLS